MIYTGNMFIVNLQANVFFESLSKSLIFVIIQRIRGSTIFQVMISFFKLAEGRGLSGTTRWVVLQRSRRNIPDLSAVIQILVLTLEKIELEKSYPQGDIFICRLREMLGWNMTVSHAEWRVPRFLVFDWLIDWPSFSQRRLPWPPPFSQLVHVSSSISRLITGCTYCGPPNRFPWFLQVSYYSNLVAIL